MLGVPLSCKNEFLTSLEFWLVDHTDRKEEDLKEKSSTTKAFMKDAAAQWLKKVKGKETWWYRMSRSRLSGAEPWENQE